MHVAAPNSLQHWEEKENSRTAPQAGCDSRNYKTFMTFTSEATYDKIFSTWRSMCWTKGGSEADIL
jgi:hypothetical protein